MSREEDKRVAEILGYTLEMFPFELIDPQTQRLVSNTRVEYERWTSSDGEQTYHSPPEFTSDPTADYQVLEWVRKNLALPRPFNDFTRAFHDACSERYALVHEDWKFHIAAWYEPGDYSRSLLELDKKGLLK